MTAYNVSSTSIKVQWESIPLDSQNGIILRYCVTVMRNSIVISNVSAASSTREIVVTGLAKRTTYQVSVAGVTVNGTGVKSRPVNVTTDEDGNYLCFSASYLKIAAHHPLIYTFSSTLLIIQKKKITSPFSEHLASETTHHPKESTALVVLQPFCSVICILFFIISYRRMYKVW